MELADSAAVAQEEVALDTAEAGLGEATLELLRRVDAGADEANAAVREF